MKKTSQPFFYLLIWVSLCILISLACNFPMRTGQSLSFDPRAEDGTVTGAYHNSNEKSDAVVNFIVTIDGFATFQTEGAPYSEAVSVLLSDEKSANMTWSGNTFDGLGPLTDDEQVALANLMDSDLGQSIALIPLDAACQGEGVIDPKQLAALLVPLQIHFKYLVSDRGTEAKRLMGLSECDHGNETENIHQILFAPSIPVPVVFGYFPFDKEGAVESIISNNPKVKVACLDSAPLLTSRRLKYVQSTRDK